MKKVIDATDRTLGRVASEAAALLVGKDSVDFVKHEAPKVQVHVENASKLRIDPKKLLQKEYKRYSGYPGGLTHEAMGDTINRKGYTFVVENAVKGMLPKNKLQSVMLKNLVVTE